MEIVNEKKLKNALELLEEAMDLIQDSIAIEDNEIHGHLDFYDQVNDVVLGIEDQIEKGER